MLEKGKRRERELLNLRQPNSKVKKAAAQGESRREKIILNEEGYRTFWEDSPDMIALVSEGKFVYVNPAGVQLLGASEPIDLLGKPISTFYHPDFVSVIEERIRQLREGKKVPLLEEKYIRLDGKVVDVEVAATPVPFQSRPLTQVVIRDITQRKRAEAALRKSEEEAQRLARENAVLAEIGRIIGSTLSIEGVYKLFSATVKKLLPFDRLVISLVNQKEKTVVRHYVEGIPVSSKNQGDVFPLAGSINEAVILSRKGIIIDGQTDEDVLAKFPGLSPVIQKGIKALLSVPLISRDEVIGVLHFRSQTEGVYSEKNLKVAHSIANQIAGAIANAQLQYERHEAEEALGESEERYRNIFNNAQIGLFRTRISDGMVLEANLRAAQAFGYESREECIGDYVTSQHYLDPGGRDRLLAELHKTDEIRNLEIRLSKRDGTPCWVRVTAKIFPEKGFLEGIVADIAQEKAFQEKLREGEERYRQLVENAPLGIFSMDLEGNVLDVNSRALSILGSPSAEAARAINLFTSPALAGVAGHFRRCRETREGSVFEISFRRKWGKDGYLRVHYAPIMTSGVEVKGVQCLIEDISMRKELELQLFQAQKMEAIGTLAGGIAHDFNNILTAMIGYAELASLEIEDSTAKTHIQHSILAAHRGKDLVRQILAFGRAQRQDRRPVDIRPIIKEGLKFLRASLPATIEVSQSIEEELGTIDADPTQIHQVLMNLCTNAAHAMEGQGGKLDVSLTRFNLTPELTGDYPGLQAGPYVKLRVSDTGHGIPPEVLPRIFDPYFTTKEVGKGTGLGLAVVHGIVKSCSGTIRVSSAPGEGTTFDIFLPRMEAVKAPLPPDRNEPLAIGRNERILFVDDESAIVEVAQAMLEHLGYKVEGRTSSIEARELFRANPDRFDLVITDMTMPNMTGDKLAQEILALRPGIPIILCTGFSELITEEKARALGIRELVMKPLVPRDLAKIIRRVIEKQKEG